MKLALELDLKITRCCDCSRWFGYEHHGRGFAGCPYCLNDSHVKANAEADKLRRALKRLKLFGPKARRRR